MVALIFVYMAGLRTAGFYSLFAKFNKKKGTSDETDQEGLIESLGELTLEKDDDELIALTKSWDLLYSGSTTKVRIWDEGNICEKYWLGRQFPDTEYENGKRPLTDNVIFPNFETLLAQATQQNPEAVVVTDNGIVKPPVAPQPPSPLNPLGTPGVPAVMMSEIGDKVHMSLEYLAREINLKGVLKKGTRHWGLRFVGAFHILWDGEEEELTVRTYNPKELILDPNASIDEKGNYHGDFVGIKLTDTAANLITRFPSKKKEIETECKSKLGSLMGYVQWRTDEFVVYTMKNIVLFKHKNEFWNYEQETLAIDEQGQPQMQKVPGQNHWKRPKIPMKFLVVFNLGDEPADKTSLIHQALVTQDNINKGLKQYDRNVDNINGGVVVNGLMFNKEQSAQVAEARRQGRTIVTPGKPEDAIYYPPSNPVPDSLMERVQDDRNQIAQRMGTYGSTPQGTQQEETVRGKIIAGDQDTSRTGGGITSALETVAAGIYDDLLQGIYVFWDTPHKVSVLGPDNAETFIDFQASDIPPGRKIVVAVQDGSMVPQDELSQYNQAMSEWEGGVSDPLSYYEAIKDPNPLERAQKLMTFKTNPAQYMQQYLQVAPPMPPPPVAEGGDGSTSGAPPSAVSPPSSVPSPVQSQESNLIKQVPIK